MTLQHLAWVGGAAYTIISTGVSVAWVRRMNRRLAALEAAEGERDKAENSTIVQRPTWGHAKRPTSA